MPVRLLGCQSVCGDWLDDNFWAERRTCQGCVCHTWRHFQWRIRKWWRKGTKNQWFVAVYDDKYAKMVELTFHIDGNGFVRVYSSGARYKAMSAAAAKTAFSSTQSIYDLYITSHGQ